MKRQSEALEAKLFGSSRSAGRSGFWIRQLSVDGASILRIGGRDPEAGFVKIEAFNFEPDGSLAQRVDAAKANLEPGYWKMNDATVVTPGFQAEHSEVYLLADQVERAGLDATPYRLRYQQLIAMPALLAAMVLVASCFSLRLFRMGGVQKMVSSGVATGFMLYVATKVVGDLGGVGIVSPAVAGWSPAVIGCLFGVYVLLHQEDG